MSAVLMFEVIRFEQGPYSPAILKNIFCLILQIFPVLEAFECNTFSDWLNHTV